MKALTVFLVFLTGLTASADRLSLDLGLSSDKISVETYSNSARTTNSTSTSQNSIDLGATYLMTFSYPVGLEQSLSLNNNKFSELTKYGFLRYDLLGSIELTEKLRIKIGPSVAYWYNTYNSDLTGFGFKAAVEYQIQENLYVDLGFYRSLFKNSSAGYDFETKIESVKLKVGFGF